MRKPSYLFFFISLFAGGLGGCLAEAPSVQHQASPEEQDPIVHHLRDGHTWHFATIGHHHVTLYLPVLLYKKGQGWQAFSSRRFWDAQHHPSPYKCFVLRHGRIEALDGAAVYDFSFTKNVLLWI